MPKILPRCEGLVLKIDPVWGFTGVVEHCHYNAG